MTVQTRTVRGINAQGQIVETVVTFDPDVVAARKAARQLERDKAVLISRAKVELAATDHWAMPDYDKPLTPERRAYREALRAIVRNHDPSQPFPVKPV